MIQSLCSCLKNKHLCVDSLERATTNPTSGGSRVSYKLLCSAERLLPELEAVRRQL